MQYIFEMILYIAGISATFLVRILFVYLKNSYIHLHFLAETVNKPRAAIKKLFAIYFWYYFILIEVCRASTSSFGKICEPSPITFYELTPDLIPELTPYLFPEITLYLLQFMERRREALERFVNRTAAHPILRTDPPI